MSSGAKVAAALPVLLLAVSWAGRPVSELSCIFSFVRGEALKYFPQGH